MSEIDVVLLGMLKKKAQSAYDLQKAVEFRNVSYWVKISNPSIYKNVRELEKKGFIEGKSVKNGNMPQKIIYQITQDGTQYLQDEIFKLSQNEIRLFQSMNAVILNLELLPEQQQKECMLNIHEQIHFLKEHIEQQMQERTNVNIPISGQLIISQQKQLIDVLNQWSIDAMKKLEMEEN